MLSQTFHMQATHMHTSQTHSAQCVTQGSNMMFACSSVSYEKALQVPSGTESCIVPRAPYETSICSEVAPPAEVGRCVPPVRHAFLALNAGASCLQALHGGCFLENLFKLKKWMHEWPHIILDSLVPVYRDVHSGIGCIRSCNVITMS